MKLLDRVLQRWRMEKVRPYLRPGDRVLDVGAADGALFRCFPWVGEKVAVEPELHEGALPPGVRGIRGTFPEACDALGGFDAVVMLAMLEHVPPPEQPALARAVHRLLVPGGVLLVTVPSPRVDDILEVLMRLRLLDGMETDEHYGFEVATTRPLFESAGLTCIEERAFQLGLNHFFAFKRG